MKTVRAKDALHFIKNNYDRDQGINVSHEIFNRLVKDATISLIRDGKAVIAKSKSKHGDDVQMMLPDEMRAEMVELVQAAKDDPDEADGDVNVICITQDGKELVRFSEDMMKSYKEKTLIIPGESLWILPLITLKDARAKFLN